MAASQYFEEILISLSLAFFGGVVGVARRDRTTPAEGTPQPFRLAENDMGFWLVMPSAVKGTGQDESTTERAALRCPSPNRHHSSHLANFPPRGRV